jgi:hypothetical protein
VTRWALSNERSYRDHTGEAHHLITRRWARSGFADRDDEEYSRDSIRLDARRLDDRPPLLSLGLLIGGECLRRLLLTRVNLLAKVG